MSTYTQIIAHVDENKPNAFSSETKLNWLTTLDGKIAADVFLMDIREIQTLPREYPEALECEPLVGFPHEDIYEHWLEAKIDYANGEYDKYQNSMEAYNAVYNGFVNWFLNTYDPVQGYLRGD